MEIEKILALANDCKLEYLDAVRIAESMQLELNEFANHFAIQLAIGYRDRKYDFEFCDGAANWLFGFMMQDFFLLAANNEVPSPAYEIYLAFDEGEYHHRGDAVEVVAEEKYTKPQINQILAKANL